MKNTIVVLVSLLLVSCQFQNKAEIEKAKQASIDSMQRVIEQERLVEFNGNRISQSN